MMGRQKANQSQLFYLFNLEARIPAHHLLRRMNPVVSRILADLREKLEEFYSEIGRPSIDPELDGHAAAQELPFGGNEEERTEAKCVRAAHGSLVHRNSHSYPVDMLMTPAPSDDLRPSSHRR